MLMPPPEGYELDNLLVDLSKEITKPELEELKQRFRHVKHVQTPREMFDCLRSTGFIGYNNIIYIQQMVRVLERIDLVEKMLTYAQLFEEDKVLHYFQTTTKTADGFIIVRFHIKGIGISHPEQVETLRSVVARILLCPQNDVIVNGIQATNSTIVTLMMPTMYVDFLAKQLEKHSQRIISSLVLLDVDRVILTNNEFEFQKIGNFYKAKKTGVMHESVQQANQECSTHIQWMDTQKPTHAPMKVKKIPNSGKNKLLQNDNLVTGTPTRSMSHPTEISTVRENLIEVNQMTDTEAHMKDEESFVDQDQLSKRQNIENLEDKIHSNRSQDDIPYIQAQYTKGREMKRKYQNEHENLGAELNNTVHQNPPIKKFKTEAVETTEPEAISKYDYGNLNKYENPKGERHLTMDKEPNEFMTKAVNFSSMNTTFRKLLSELPNEDKKRRRASMVTPEEINALSLYRKLDRIYPKYYPKYSYLTPEKLQISMIQE